MEVSMNCCRDRESNHPGRVAPGRLAAIAALLVPLLVGAQHARADAGLVLVESVSAPVPGLEPMDYVNPGITINLGGSTVVVLDHLATCTRETVTGGVLTVGSPGSQVEGGTIEVSHPDCDGRRLQLDAAKAQGGGQVYRDISRRPLVLHSTMPVILTGRGGPIRIERVDIPGPAIDLVAREPETGRFVSTDLSRWHEELAPGGKYLLTFGDRQETFLVDSEAKGGPNVPLLARLLPI